MTTKVTCPARSSFTPSVRETSLQRGGKMLETRTRLQAAIPADRKANSKLVSFSRCFPTPLVKNMRLATNIRPPPPSRRPCSFGYPSDVTTRTDLEDSISGYGQE